MQIGQALATVCTIPCCAHLTHHLPGGQLGAHNTEKMEKACVSVQKVGWRLMFICYWDQGLECITGLWIVIVIGLSICQIKYRLSVFIYQYFANVIGAYRPNGGRSPATIRMLISARFLHFGAPKPIFFLAPAIPIITNDQTWSSK